MERDNILIIEDDPSISKGVSLLLSGEGYDVLCAENGNVGLEVFDDSIDLVILDVMMPGLSGFETCEKIRETSNVPILFLTAKATEMDKVHGFDVGGDDYLSKPFSFQELLSRVKALLRRYSIYQGKYQKSVKVIKNGNITIDEDLMEVKMDGKVVYLTDLEYQILHFFMLHPKKVFSAKELYEEIWNEPYLYTSNGTIMVHIRKLRTKLEHNPDQPEHIKTIWGKGYCFE